jgi:hypothetical protein
VQVDQVEPDPEPPPPPLAMPPQGAPTR